MGPKGSYDQAVLDMVSRPLSITPTTPTSVNPRVKYVLDRMIIDGGIINNIAWAIESMIETKGVGIHFFGKYSIERTQKGEIFFCLKYICFIRGKIFLLFGFGIS